MSWTGAHHTLVKDTESTEWRDLVGCAVLSLRNLLWSNRSSLPFCPNKKTLKDAMAGMCEQLTSQGNIRDVDRKTESGP